MNVGQQVLFESGCNGPPSPFSSTTGSVMTEVSAELIMMKSKSEYIWLEETEQFMMKKTHLEDCEGLLEKKLTGAMVITVPVKCEQNNVPWLKLPFLLICFGTSFSWLLEMN